ncbi:hypothetical protein [Streptomyces caniscabiei]|uniref:hypothetical protein n=1 Tax=Streptomyces caniscabiei TaxID=2746961 RepID=UPI001872DE98|nr:hypothetical protein [Streptomyces caniscabiei]MBE4783942.1 hypothetical protein [Streptomyces caniscabiei]MBE4791559.1 hypothetical protein [Streptomyces caniscabiei]MDX3009204.1 hypothetical protein [Streptomyces caniscabiei]
MPDAYPIAFVDCETTHLDASIGEAWEVAVILREQHGEQTTDTEYAWQIRPNLAKADPEALRIGRYEERFAVPPNAEAAWTADESGHVAPMTRREAVTAIVNVLSGAVLVGSNPGFDDRHLRRLVGRGRAQWHYRPYDIVQLAAAKIGAQAAGPLPWRAHVLSRAVGIEPPTAEAAHTALGDARWARDVYDAAMAREKFPLSWEGRAQHAIGLYTSTAIQLEDAERERDEHKRDYLSACATIAAMHKAAVGEVRGPARGVVEDVEDVRAGIERVRGLHRKATHGDDCVHCVAFGPAYDNTWPCETLRRLDGPSQPVNAGETPCTCTVGEACDQCADDDQDDEEFEEDGDSDGDVFELISEIATRLRDATDSGEYHAVGLIYDLANGRTTIADARAELADIEFGHV